MNANEAKTLTRDVEASVVPVGTKVTLQKGGQAYVTQSLGGAFTVIVNGNMFRIDGKDADAPFALPPRSLRTRNRWSDWAAAIVFEKATCWKRSFQPLKKSWPPEN